MVIEPTTPATDEDEEPRPVRRRRRRAPEAIENPAPAPAPAADAADEDKPAAEDDRPVATDTAATSDDNNAASENARSEGADRVNGNTERPKLPVYDSIDYAYVDLARINKALNGKRDIFLAEIRYAREPGVDTLMENPMKRLKRQIEYNEAAKKAMAADPSCQKLEAERSLILEVIRRHERKRDRQLDLKEQEKKYGKLAWQRTLKEKSRTNPKGHRIGIEALYLMMSKGENCRFCGLYGDPARMAGLLIFIFIVTDPKGKVKFDDNPHVLKGELSNAQFNYAVASVTGSIMNMCPSIYEQSATKLARIIVDAALYGMGMIVHNLAMDITRNPELSKEWMTHFERGLREMEHNLVSESYGNPYAVRMRQRKIRTADNQPLDVLSNVYTRGKRGALKPMAFVDLTGAVLNFNTDNLHKLPEKAALQATQMALTEQPGMHSRKRDLRENAAYIKKVIENAEKGFKAARTSEEYVRNTAAFRRRRLDVIRRSGFVLEDQPITPKQAHEITDALKGPSYDPATESFTAIMSHTKSMLGDDGNKYDNIYEIQTDIARSDGHWTDGDMAFLKALLARLVESLSRSNVKRKSSGSSRVIDFSNMYRRDWNDPKAMDTPWSGELLAEQFERVTRDMDVRCHDDVIEQDKEFADLVFNKKGEKEQETRTFAKNGAPSFVTPKDIENTPYSSVKVEQDPKFTSRSFALKYGRVTREGTDEFKAAARSFEPMYEFVYRKENGTDTSWKTASKFAEDIRTADIVNGKVYMSPSFSRSYYGGDEAEYTDGKIDRFPCPTSIFLKTEKGENGESTVKSVADAHFYDDDVAEAAILLLSILQNKRRISFDRAIKGVLSLDKILSTREYNGIGSMPLSSRYFSMQSGISHNECNRLMQDLEAIGLIDRAGGKLQGTLLGPAETEKERAVQELCERVGPGIIGQERVAKQGFVENGQFLSTYTTFHKDGFIAEKDGETYRFTAKEIIEGFKNLDSVTDSDNPFMMVIESACRRLDAAVDRTRDMTEDTWRKSNLYEVRMGYVQGKVEVLTEDQYRMPASNARALMSRMVSYVTPSKLNGLTDVGVAFRSTSKLYKDDSDPELMRTYGYWLSLLIDSSITNQVSENDLKSDFSKIIRFVNGRGSMAQELLKRVQCFTGDILSMERAALSWKAYVADLAAAAREFRRSYRALLGAVSKGVEALSDRDVDLSSLVRSGPPPVGRS